MTAFPSAARMPSAADEKKRATILRNYGILDTGAERAFDDLTALASQLCDAPASIITFIDGDRLWFKSTFGLTAKEAPVEHSFCAHAAGRPDEVFTIDNALVDDRFLRNIFVMPEDGLRAYAGANIVAKEGVALGSICVVDFEARAFTDAQRQALERLSRQVVDQLELRRRVVQVERQRERFRREAEHFERVAYLLTHDFRQPLSAQRGIIEAIREDHGSELPDEVADLLSMLDEGAEKSLRSLASVARYLKEGSTDGQMTEVNVKNLLHDLEEELSAEAKAAEFTVDIFGVKLVRTQQVALRHILLNLVANAVKYIGRPDGKVNVKVHRKGNSVLFCVTDNGPGIPEEERERIFQPFGRGSSAAGTEGTGIGLSVSQRLAASLGGILSVRDAEGGGCTFTLRLPG